MILGFEHQEAAQNPALQELISSKLTPEALDATAKVAIDYRNKQNALKDHVYSFKPEDTNNYGAGERTGFERLKQNIINTLQGFKTSLAGMTGIDNDKLKDLLKKLDDAIGDVYTARDPSDLANALEAMGEVSGEISAAQGQNAEGGQSQAEINAEHKRLYATDAIYRAETDRITAEANKTIGDFDKEQAPKDQWAKDNNITTAYDDDVQDLRKRLEEARKNGDEREARQLQERLMASARAQDEARREQARTRGISTEPLGDGSDLQRHEEESRTQKRQQETAVDAALARNKKPPELNAEATETIAPVQSIALARSDAAPPTIEPEAAPALRADKAPQTATTQQTAQADTLSSSLTRVGVKMAAADVTNTALPAKPATPASQQTLSV